MKDSEMTREYAIEVLEYFKIGACHIEKVAIDMAIADMTKIIRDEKNDKRIHDPFWKDMWEHEREEDDLK